MRYGMYGPIKRAVDSGYWQWAGGDDATGAESGSRPSAAGAVGEGKRKGGASGQTVQAAAQAAGGKGSKGKTLYYTDTALWTKVLSGALAGGVAAAVCNPIDLVKVLWSRGVVYELSRKGKGMDCVVYVADGRLLWFGVVCKWKDRRHRACTCEPACEHDKTEFGGCDDSLK